VAKSGAAARSCSSGASKVTIRAGTTAFSPTLIRHCQRFHDTGTVRSGIRVVSTTSRFEQRGDEGRVQERQVAAGVFSGTAASTVTNNQADRNSDTASI
jgi:hypothetical protein